MGTVVEAKDSFGLQRRKLMNKAVIVVSKDLMKEETHSLFYTCLEATLRKIEDL